MRIHSELPIDVVIPAAEKDVAVLGLAIDGIRRNAKHPIQSILGFSTVGSDRRTVPPKALSFRL